VTAVVDRARELVRRHLDQHRSELEQLVDQELDNELARLVAERVEQRNGNGAAEPVVATCPECGERPVEHGRRTCRRCRSARERRHAATGPDHTGAGEVPRPAGQPGAGDAQNGS